MPPELRVDKVTWLLSDMQPAEVDMRRLILGLVDEKVFHIQEGQDEEGDTQRAVQNKTEQYNALQPKVNKTSWFFVCLVFVSLNFCSLPGGPLFFGVQKILSLQNLMRVWAMVSVILAYLALWLWQNL